LRRVLATKFKLGLFDPAERVPYSQAPISKVDGPEHRSLARKAAEESIVMLKNANGALPLRPDISSILMTGPTAATVGALIGNYYGLSGNLITLVEGVVERVSDSTRVKYRQGCAMSQQVAPVVNYAFGAADGSEVVIAVLGFDNTLEGEEGDAVASPHGGDRPRIELPEVQRAFLKEMRKHAKKLILILTGGSAIAIPEEFEYCDAVLQVWYPGCEGGRAVAKVLFGDVSPSGKLPVTVPRSTEDLPAFNDYSMAGRTYRYAEKEPLFPFGYGLGYAPFSLGKVSATRSQLKEGEQVTFTATLENRGKMEAQETVQLYLVPPQGDPLAPKAVLADFCKLHVAAGASAEVRFELTSAAFRQVNKEGVRVWLKGEYEVVLGFASPSPRAQALGVAAPVQTWLTLV
jgi:beta-glucosidase